jgi:hypothetical protein
VALLGKAYTEKWMLNINEMIKHLKDKSARDQRVVDMNAHITLMAGLA